MTMLDLAHITDVHLGPLPRARLRELAGKRALGFLSWHRNRHRLHRIEVLAALAEDLAADPPDHIVVTGDLVNIALPGEFETAARWLEATATPDSLTLVPGNHDAYTPEAWRVGWQRWQAYMRGDDDAVAGLFPFVRRRGRRLALVGLSSAVPTGFGQAWGRLGPGQIEALGPILADLREEGRTRIVLVHHPPLGSLVRGRRGLRDEADLRAVIAREGAELVLAGHEHVFRFGSLAGPDGPVPVVAGPSASLIGGVHGSGGYLRYYLDPVAAPPVVTMQLRRFDPASGRLVAEPATRIELAGDGLVLMPAPWPARLASAKQHGQAVVD